MLNNLKRYKWIYIWALLSILYAFVIHWLFNTPGTVWSQAKWGAGDILTYASTVSLGLLALWQNEKFQSLQAKKDMQSLAINHYPLFEVTKCTARFISRIDGKPDTELKVLEPGFNGNIGFWKLKTHDKFETLKIILTVHNIGNTLATNIRVNDCTGKPAEHTNILIPSCEVNTKKHIQCDESGEVLINVCMDNLKKKKKLEYFLSFWNPFGSYYQQKIDISLTSNLIISVNVGCSIDIVQEI